MSFFTEVYSHDDGGTSELILRVLADVLKVLPMHSNPEAQDAIAQRTLTCLKARLLSEGTDAKEKTSIFLNVFGALMENLCLDNTRFLAQIIAKRGWLDGIGGVLTSMNADLSFSADELLVQWGGMNNLEEAEVEALKILYSVFGAET